MKARKTLIAANWKMHKTVEEAVTFVKDLQERLPFREDRNVMIAPPFTALIAVRSAIRRNDIWLGAQNCHWEDKGPFTGEVSPLMLYDVGCQFAIIGHSERRHIFGETDEMVNRKVKAVLGKGLRPILCVGEKLEEREVGETFNVVSRQLKEGLKGVGRKEADRVVIAYEPVWAIGTGRTAKPYQAQEVHAFIRGMLSELYDNGLASSVQVLYGGSVKPDNVDELMAEPDIDGLLVGGASLEVDSFCRIVSYRV
ncbi:MAG: triose-phosphate isomerase [Syntrophobacterales bacterium]|nr:triose-phosphate isomerase [Syntrophobacterales bacterium]